MDRQAPVEVVAIILIGLPGAGKTSVGEVLATLLGLPLIDSDRLIESKENQSVSEIFASRGEKYFRNLETALLENIKSTNFVLSCGGGLPITPGNMDMLLSIGHVVYLKAAIDELTRRLKATHDRPLLKDKLTDGNFSDEQVLRKRLGELLASRQAVYERAQLTVHTDSLTPYEVAEKISEKVRPLLL